MAMERSGEGGFKVRYTEMKKLTSSKSGKLTNAIFDSSLPALQRVASLFLSTHAFLLHCPLYLQEPPYYWRPIRQHV